ncbi:FHA domain-containing protein [Spirillospora sp. NPDC049652]
MAVCPAGHSSGSDDYCDVCGERIGGASAPSAAPSAAPPAAPSATGAPPLAPAPGMPTQAMTASGIPCPDCGTPAADRFCEQCGYDFATGGGRPSPRPKAAEPSEPMRPPSLPQPPGHRSNPPGPPMTPPATPPPVTRNDPPTGPPAQPSGPSGPHGPHGPSGGGWVAIVAADRAYYDAVIAMNGPDAARIVFPPFAPERRIPLSGERVLIGRRSPSRGTDPQIDLRHPPEDPGVSHTHAVLLARPDGRWSLVDPGSANGTCVNGSADPIPNNVEVPVGEGDRVHVGAWTTITLTRGGTP